MNGPVIGKEVIEILKDEVYNTIKEVRKDCAVLDEKVTNLAAKARIRR